MEFRTAILALPIAVLALAGCERSTADANGSDAGARVDGALERAQEQLSRAGEQTQKKMAEVGEKTGEKLDELGRQAGKIRDIDVKLGERTSVEVSPDAGEAGKP